MSNPSFPNSIRRAETSDQSRGPKDGISPSQSVTHWLSAHADKFKFVELIIPQNCGFFNKTRNLSCPGRQKRFLTWRTCRDSCSLPLPLAAGLAPFICHRQRGQAFRIPFQCNPIKKHPIRGDFLLAHLSGFEPKAFRLGGGRSILLSYRCRFGSEISSEPCKFYHV